MIKPDYSEVKDLFLAYPEGFDDGYHSLKDFYVKLIEIIPDEINLFIIVNNKEAEREINVLFPHKKIKVILIPDFNEIWLRDILGFNTGMNRIYKPIFSPDYCTNI